MNAAWLKYLPKPVRSRLENRRGLQAAIGNSGWLFGDKIVRLGVELIIGVWIARYLGPDQFGVWNFAIAFAALFGAIATLGLDGIVVRELVRNPAHRNELLGSAFVLKLAGGGLAIIICLIAINFVRSDDPLTFYLVALSSAGFVFQSLNVIDYYFQAKVLSKYTVLARNSAFVLMTIVKVVLLLTSAPLVAFAWAGFGEIVLACVFLVVAYHAKQGGIRHWTFSAPISGQLLRDSWPLILSGLAIMLYMRIDQIMIGQMLGDTQVGLYSAASRLSELWYVVPMTIVSSVFPAIIESKKQGEAIYYGRMQKLFNTMTWLGVIAAVFMTFASELIIRILFGPSYAESAHVLAIHIWAGIFVGLGLAGSSWLTTENLQRYSLYRTVAACIINIALNFLWIPAYGIGGAAAATVVAQISVGLAFDLCNSRTRIIFWMKLKSFNPLFAVRS